MALGEMELSGVTNKRERETAYEPARGSGAIVCWILILACAAIVLVSLGAWMVQPDSGLPFLEILLPMLVILGAIARLQGWAPPPKGISGGGGP